MSLLKLLLLLFIIIIIIAIIYILFLRAEKQRILADASKKVREEAFYMKRAIDGDDLKTALDHATDMLRELKSSTLNPKTYYEIYMKVH